MVTWWRCLRNPAARACATSPDPTIPTFMRATPKAQWRRHAVPASAQYPPNYPGRRRARPVCPRGPLVGCQTPRRPPRLEGTACTPSGRPAPANERSDAGRVGRRAHRCPGRHAGDRVPRGRRISFLHDLDAAAQHGGSLPVRKRARGGAAVRLWLPRRAAVLPRLRVCDRADAHALRLTARVHPAALRAAVPADAGRLGRDVRRASQPLAALLDRRCVLLPAEPHVRPPLRLRPAVRAHRLRIHGRGVLVAVHRGAVLRVGGAALLRTAAPLVPAGLRGAHGPRHRRLAPATRDPPVRDARRRRLAALFALRAVALL